MPPILTIAVLVAPVVLVIWLAYVAERGETLATLRKWKEGN